MRHPVHGKGELGFQASKLIAYHLEGPSSTELPTLKALFLFPAEAPTEKKESARSAGLIDVASSPYFIGKHAPQRGSIVAQR